MSYLFSAVLVLLKLKVDEYSSNNDKADSSREQALDSSAVFRSPFSPIINGILDVF